MQMSYVYLAKKLRYFVAIAVPYHWTKNKSLSLKQVSD